MSVREHLSCRLAIKQALARFIYLESGMNQECLSHFFSKSDSAEISIELDIPSSLRTTVQFFSAGMIRLLANYVHVKPLAVGPQDILFDACSHLVKKFILHTNFPGHYNFNM